MYDALVKGLAQNVPENPTQSQPSRHTFHSGAHLTQQLPHIDTQSMHKKAQQYNGPPSEKTRSQYNSSCKTRPDHTAPHQTPGNIYLSLPLPTTQL